MTRYIPVSTGEEVEEALQDGRFMRELNNNRESYKQAEAEKNMVYRYTYSTDKLPGITGKRYTVYAKNEQDVLTRARNISKASEIFLIHVEELQP